MTAPLRATLKAQFESGRIFPMYEPDQLVDAVEMYVRLTGNPIWANTPPTKALECVKRYQASWDPAELEPLEDLLREEQVLKPAVSRYFSPENRKKGLILRDVNGVPCPGRGVRGKFLLVSDVEKFLSTSVQTKISDLAELTLDNGTTIGPWELLFLMPKRPVGAGRGQTVLDPRKTISIGIADSSLLTDALGERNGGSPSLFQIYGKTDEDRNLRMKSHSLRYLQNTELFRLGVADTIISKRFDRRTVAQSYEYDHRSLAEEMDGIELPDAWSEYLGDSPTAAVAKLIVNGRLEGPLVREFRNIQKKEGDEAALNYLALEADGFHATPYGFCLNSFTVDPCPKHLECFTGCGHLSVTDLPENRKKCDAAVWPDEDSA